MLDKHIKPGSNFLNAAWAMGRTRSSGLIIHPGERSDVLRESQDLPQPLVGARRRETFFSGMILTGNE